MENVKRNDETPLEELRFSAEEYPKQVLSEEVVIGSVTVNVVEIKDFNKIGQLLLRISLGDKQKIKDISKSSSSLDHVGADAKNI